MCGIFCIYLNSTDCQDEELLKFLDLFKDNISNRGPDNTQHKFHNENNYNLLFAASVLWLQGSTITEQPVENETSLFVYNGDVFGEFISNTERETYGDTTLILKHLENNLSKALLNSEGPYSFVWLNKAQNKLYFGRDVYGRRSLLIGIFRNGLVLTSVAKRNPQCEFMELPAIGIFCLDLKTNDLRVIPWPHRNLNFETKLEETRIFLKRNNIEVQTLLLPSEHKTFLAPTNHDLSLLDSIKNQNIEHAFCNLLTDANWNKRVLKLKMLLETAVSKRISTQPKFCKNCITEKLNCTHCLTGVLFSGGVDCAILALLADKYSDKTRPIDLINVAFDEAKNYITPDRLTGLATLSELQQIVPDRKWNFLEVNVSKSELDYERKNHISDLIYPLNTILDDSLGCALWFASRGKTSSYTSPSRVLLVGMGADELFGGYTRHRASLQKNSWRGLYEVLNEDWQNLSHRNLGRDDRVVSDHGRQLRTPYLDEEVVGFVRNLDSWNKTCPSKDFPQGFGEKILLRSLAYHLGLKNAAALKKRALQFGSRIANSKENAHEISPRL